MTKLNGDNVLVIESDTDNKITYVELPNGAKQWVNNCQLEYSEPQAATFEDDQTIVVKKTKKINK